MTVRFRYSKKRAPLSVSVNGSHIFLYVVVIATVLFSALPLIYMISTSLKPLDELFVFPPRFFVNNPTSENFKTLFMAMNSSVVPFTRYLFNSIVVSGTIVFFSIMVCSLGAYGLVKHSPGGARVISLIVTSALMFSVYVTQVPNYFVVKEFGLLDSYAALILPKIAVAYNFFLMQQFITQIPDTLLEAARIDGAGELRIFFRLVMPMLKPAWATLVVFSFIANWNDYFSPLIFITDQSMKTLPLALQSIAGSIGTVDISRFGASSAASFIMTIPTITLFFLMQRMVMNTMAFSGIKG